MTTSERVVVTGLGVLAPNGHGLQAFAGALREGKSGIKFHQHLADVNFGCQVGGIPEGVAELQKTYLTDEELLAMNPNMIYAAIAAIDAFKDAGLARVPSDVDEKPPELPDDPKQLPWTIGAMIDIDLELRQRLLSELSPAARLTTIDGVLRKAIPDLELRAAMHKRA